MRHFSIGLISGPIIRLLPMLATALMLIAPLGSNGRAQSGQDRLQQLEQTIIDEQSQAEALTAEAARQAAALESLQAQMVVSARAVQQHEVRVTSLTGEIVALDLALVAVDAGLAVRRRELAATLSALQRVALVPPAALLAQPVAASTDSDDGIASARTKNSAGDMVRGAIVLSTLLHAVEERATALRADLEQMAALRTDLVASRTALATVGAALESQRTALAALAADRRAAGHQTEDERRDSTRRLAALAEQATSLRQLLDAAAPPPLAIVTRPRAAASDLANRPPMAQARGLLFIPATGEIRTRFGEKDASGSAAHGLTFDTPSSATVVSPYSGTIVFAGPFRSYGQILIIEHGDGYHSLLAGMARIDGDVGQWLTAGEPVGAMAPLSVGGPSLYVELRHNGEPVDPLPWLAANVTPQEGQG